MSDTDRAERIIFGGVILGGYVLSMGTLAFHQIPEANTQLFTGVVGSLGTAVGVIVHAIWKRDAGDARQQNITQTLADKVPPPVPAGDPAFEIPPPRG